MGRSGQVEWKDRRVKRFKEATEVRRRGSEPHTLSIPEPDVTISHQAHNGLSPPGRILAVWLRWVISSTRFQGKRGVFENRCARKCTRGSNPSRIGNFDIARTRPDGSKALRSGRCSAERRSPLGLNTNSTVILAASGLRINIATAAGAFRPRAGTTARGLFFRLCPPRVR